MATGPRHHLVDAVWAVVGEDPLAGVLGVLRPVLADAVPGVDPQVTADALIRAASGSAWVPQTPWHSDEG